MRQRIIYPIWGIIYILCVALGFITERKPILSVALVIISVLFFVPGIILLVDAYKENDRKALLRLRYISLGSLVLTLVVLVATFISAPGGSETVGKVLHYILAAVSAPMLCSGVWVLTIFLWACLFMASFPKIIGK